MHETSVTSTIGIIGVAGGLAEHIATEAAARGHEVTAFVDDPERWSAPVTAVRRAPRDLTRPDLAEFDVLINAYQVPAGRERDHLSVNRHLLLLLARSPIRLITVGDPGPLFADASRTSIHWQQSVARGPRRKAGRTMERVFFLYKINRDVLWTYLAPPIELVGDGERTGHYRAGGDVLLTDEQGRSRISKADYAVAMVDEVEAGAHPRRMFTVAA
ncbi:NAD(P)-dependent oxidoreductase [Nocardiopsis listeri]|uniref:NAD(P)-dependent oxidoreductase n=1 Tax=Nocardiopsis listeri TaxID=53440 RepID=UPI00082A7045|nr:NAD(P)H-binding protein [Nocardiopsis listeri]